MEVIVENAKCQDNKILLKSSDDQIINHLMSGNICIFKNVFSEDACKQLKKAVIGWANNTTAHDPAKSETAPGRTDNWHRYDNNPAKSQTPHIFHAHNFDNVNALQSDLQSILKTIFVPMIDLQNRLAGTTGNLNELNGEYILHPQVIHYPTGGGYFGEHIHPFEPQRFGLIVDLSKKGEDFETGSTLYYDENENEIRLDEFQDVGSLTIFKYDIPHAVSVVDEGKPLSFDQESGRWVAILPYY